ncbi:coiled-coil domain-containing protein MTMR15 [Microdochium trichocladiopsis]|uniref:Fanconi-associated nuclease n=1 Tax=Microdochium trichocladiopsis TaxID=1682393 RepID=A0A9P9BSU8_9PEZI|nr:coiled-coil domain-containing protein MTMR15 [Microdochium trichocladiopsis]KAH7034964.1 coiled-coil domain-containing protein MTMR15 [Microdochium trichocladiopsis]
MDAFIKRTKVGSARQQAPHGATCAATPASPERPAKRLKRVEIADSDDDNDGGEEDDLGHIPRPTSPAARPPQNRGRLSAPDLSREGSPETDVDDRPHQPTAIESSLPAILSDEEAIEQYESFKASQSEAGTDEAETAAARLDSRKWIRGKSSLYVDAFNLALDTVLDEESHLFNSRECAVFEKWRALPYESQFLYVRLFLRKNAQWHRTAKLSYHSDIQDVEAAVLDLQQTRDLPPTDDGEAGENGSLSVDYVDEQTSLADAFAFADTSDDCITTVEEAVSLLSLDEIKAFAKEAKVQGKNKGDIAKSICRNSRQQSGLFSVGLRRSSTLDSTTSLDTPTPETGSPAPDGPDDSNRNRHFLEKILAITGPCIRLSLPVFKLFERVHLVFYRSTEWTDKSLTAIILAKISRRNFPNYIVSRSANIFASRTQLLEFETSMRTEFAIDNILEFNGPVREADFRRVIEIFEKIYPRWQALLVEEQLKEDRVYESGEGAYLRRLNPGHSYTRIVHKAAHTFGRLKEHKREHELLSQLLEQRLFHLARRGAWYQRKALLEEHYMFALEENPSITNVELQKKHWKRIAITTCEIALEDRDCHLIYHYDIQKRIVKLEKQLRVPKRLQHDFGHVRLKQPEEHYVHGTQLKKDDITGKNGRGPSTKTIWIDEAEGGGECSVEAMCLSDYRAQGWKGYHAEGGIVRTLFAYLFFDILFIYIPNVFQTAYQTCPLDLHTDAFFPTRSSEINHRLVEIANGQAARLIQAVDERERERRTCVVGLNWDYELGDLLELANCFNGAALATICKVMAQEYGQRGGGIPDLVLWKTEPEREVMFSEVKSANDRLSDTQRLWIHVLTGAGIRVALCNAIADEVREA